MQQALSMYALLYGMTKKKSTEEISTEVGISVGSVNSILHEHLNMDYVSQKFVPVSLHAVAEVCRCRRELY